MKNSYHYENLAPDAGDVSLNRDRSWPSSEGPAYIVSMKIGDSYARVGVVCKPSGVDADGFSLKWVWICSQEEDGGSVVYEDRYYAGKKSATRALVSFWAKTLLLRKGPLLASPSKA